MNDRNTQLALVRQVRWTLDRLVDVVFGQQSTTAELKAARAVAPLSWLRKIWLVVFIISMLLTFAGWLSVLGWLPEELPRVGRSWLAAAPFGLAFLGVGWGHIEDHYARRLRASTDTA